MSIFPEGIRFVVVLKRNQRDHTPIVGVRPKNTYPNDPGSLFDLCGRMLQTWTSSTWSTRVIHSVNICTGTYCGLQPRVPK